MRLEVCAAPLLRQLAVGQFCAEESKQGVRPAVSQELAFAPQSLRVYVFTLAPADSSSRSAPPLGRAGRSRSPARGSGETFIPTGRWQLDSACGICGKHFNYLRGRHHCRHCGVSVCAKHSKNKAVVPSSLSTHRQRVCDSCFPECQRGVTRRRRKTVGARTISLRYETDSSGTIITNSTRSQFTDYESIATTTTRTTRTTRSNPASIVYAPPPRPPNRKIISIKSQQQPLQQQQQSQQQTPKSPHQPPLTYNYASSIENDDIEPGYQHQQQQEKRVQRQPWPRPSRRRASTSETKPKALQRYVDARSSSGSSSISSIDDHSGSSESDSDSDSEELIAKYLRRGAPIKALSSSGGPSKSMGLHRTDTPPLEAIKETHSLENLTQVDAITKTLLQAPPPLPTRKLQNRTLSSASTGTVSVTDSEEAEERTRNSDNASEYSAFSDCDEGGPVEEEDEEVLLNEPSTPPPLPSFAFKAVKEPSTPPPRAFKFVKEPSTPPPRAFKFAKEPTTPPPRAFKAVQEPRTPPPRAYKAVKEPITPPPRTLKTAAPVYSAASIANKGVISVKSELAAIPEKTQSKDADVLVQALKPAAYQITEQDRLVMQEIAALELEIQKYQSELPQLLETLQRTERTAARLREEAQESRLRVQQYRKAHCVVNRSIRNARALMKEQEYQAAILELLRASGIDRSSAIVWFMLAECRLKVGQLRDAELACRKCIKLQRHSSDREGSGTSGSDSSAACVALLGKILQDQGRHDEAIECGRVLPSFERGSQVTEAGSKGKKSEGGMAAGGGNKQRDLRVRGKQVDYSDFYTPEDAKKPRKAAGAGGDDSYRGDDDDDDDDDDDVVLPLKFSKTATSAAQSKGKDKEKEPVKKKKNGASSSTTNQSQGEAKKTKKRAHAAGEDDDFDDEGDEVVEKKKKVVKKAKKSETEGKAKQGERKQASAAAPATVVVKRKKKEQADPKEKPAAKDKERKRDNDATTNGAAKPVVKKVLSLAKPVTAASKPSSESSDLSDVTALRKKYEALKQIHETEGGRLLEDAKALALEEKKTYERLISKLKKEVSTLATRLQDDQIKREKEIEKLKTENQLRLENLERKYADSNDDSHGHRKRIKELEAQLNEARRHTKANGKAAASRSGSKAVEDNLQLAQATKLLEIYRLVTSTEIRLIETLDDDDDASYTDVSCTTVDSNTGKQFHFDLGVPADEDEEIEYLPSETPNKDFKIPSYLQDELSFKRPEMTKFMRAILDVVVRKKTQAVSSDARSNR